MKTFKKTFIALAVATASSAAFAADSLTDWTENGSTSALTGCENTCSTISAEGLTINNTTVNHKGVKIQLDADAAISDIQRVLVEVSGSKFTLNSDNNASISTDTTLSSVTNSLVSLSAIAFDFSSVALAKDESITIGDLQLNAEEASAGTVIKLTVKLQEKTTSGDYVTARTISGNIAEVVDQFAFDSSTKADNKIDSTDRLSFDGSVYTDKLDFTIAENEVNYNTAEGSGDYTLTVAGDFGFLDANGDGEIDGDNTVKGGSTAVTFASDFQSFTYKASAAEIDGDDVDLSGSVNFTFDGATEIPELTATADFEFDYTSADEAITGGVFEKSFDAVDWQLKGDSASFKYMPYGDNISQIIYVTNEGSVDGVATVTGYDSDGNKFGPVQLDTAVTAKGVTKLTGAIEDAMMAEGFDGQGPLNLSISVTGSGMSFYGAYNVGGTDRGYVPAQ